MKQAFEFVLNDPDSDQEFTECHQPVQNTTNATMRQTGVFNSTTPIQIEEFTIANEHLRVEVNSATTDQTDGLNSNFYNKIISEFPSATISDPTEMLRYLQSKIMRGRCLDVTDDSSVLVGETNFIAVTIYWK